MVSCNIKILKYPRTTLKPCPVFSKPIFNTVFMSDGGFLISCLNALWFTWFKKSWNGPWFHALKQLSQKNIKNMETAGGTRRECLLVSQQNKHGHSNLSRAGLSQVISQIHQANKKRYRFSAENNLTCMKCDQLEIHRSTAVLQHTPTHTLTLTWLRT